MSRMPRLGQHAASSAEAPKPLRGFEHINRFWDNTHGRYLAKILPGEYYVTLRDEGITTVLGSCISACIRDRKLGVGGMNHFMLPSHGSIDPGEAMTSHAARYGNYAMEHLINNILKNGGQRKNLEAKLFGGGRILAQMTDIGRRNIEFAKEYVTTEGIALIAADLGDVFPRKVIYFPANGKVLVRKLRSLANDAVMAREKDYLKDLERIPVQGDIELFE